MIQKPRTQSNLRVVSRPDSFAPGGGRERAMSQSRVPPARALFYSHDTVGLGHLRRTLAICSGLMEKFGDLTTLLLTGSAMAHGFRIPPGIDYVKLPCVKKLDNEQYDSRSLGVPFQSTFRLREEIIFQVTAGFQPDLLFVDNVPLGMKGELRKTLEFVHRYLPRTFIILNLRDILDESDNIVPLWRRQGILEAIERFYDRIYIYGMPVVFDPIREYAWTENLRGKTSFCGYLPRPFDRRASATVRREALKDRKKLVLVTVGGGVDGVPVVENYLRALPEICAQTSVASIVLLGPDMRREEAQRLRSIGTGNGAVKFMDFCEEPLPYMAAADVVVSMAGYNTISEIVSLRKPAVVIPRIHPRREQIIRSERLQSLGLLKMIHPHDLSPSLLASEVTSWFGKRGNPPTTALDFSGIDRLAGDIEALIAQNQSPVSGWERTVSEWMERTAV
jgi:predicted glycosyltransferase